MLPSPGHRCACIPEGGSVCGIAQSSLWKRNLNMHTLLRREDKKYLQIQVLPSTQLVLSSLSFPLTRRREREEESEETKRPMFCPISSAIEKRERERFGETLQEEGLEREGVGATMRAWTDRLSSLTTWILAALAAAQSQMKVSACVMVP